MSNTWVAVIPLKRTELPLLSSIPLSSGGCQDPIPKGEYFTTVILRKYTVGYAHIEPHGGMWLFRWYFQRKEKIEDFNDF